MSSSSNKKVVFCAMSGGVDSSVAAALLKKQGYEVVGVHMKCYNVDGCAEQDAEDARRAAEVLGIPFYVFDFEKEYKEKVVEYMVDGYRQGITPNPDVMCNKEIKFGLFLQKALSMGADYVATGHYVHLVERKNFVFRNKVFSLAGIEDSRSACVSCGNYGAPKCSVFCEAKNFGARRRRVPPLERDYAGAGRNASGAAHFSLQIAKDKNKDQSYFLWTLTQEQLKHCLFPIGEYRKPEVRKFAKKFGLPNAEKKDSQGICFLGRVRLGDFLSQYIKSKVGQVRLAQGNGSYKVIGQHRGAYFYTVGQRSIGVGGNSRPYYVAEKDIAENAILVAEENDPALYKNEINLRQVNFINQQPTTNNQQRVLVRVRYRQPLSKATLVTYHMSHVTCKLVFDKPQKFVAPGQSAVFYRDRRNLGRGGYEMLGGGTIA